MGARSLLPWLAAAAFLGFAARADAAPAAARTSSLAWVRSDGADACIGGKDLAEAVERILGRRVFVSASAADVAVEGHVDRVGPGWKATLRISDEHGALLGSRELESAALDCREMDGPLAFVIAVMIDPDAASRPQAPLEASRPAAPPPPPPPPPVARPASSSWTIAPRLGVSAAFGEVPSVAWGASLALRLGPPSVGVELLGSYFLPTSDAIAGAPGASVQFTWAYAGAAVCPTVARLAPVSLVGCAGALGSVRTATPKGLGGEQESTSFTVLAALRARVEWRLGSVLFAAAEGGADVPFERPEWTVTSAAGATVPVFRPSAVAGEAGVAVGVTID
jgi:hypothetical protein